MADDLQNVYDGLVQKETSSPLTSSMYSADSSPETEAGLHRLSLKTGIPLEGLRNDNGAEAKRLERVKSAEALNDAPATAAWLTENASLAHDDVDALAALERLTRNGFKQGGSTLGIASPNDLQAGKRAKSIGGAFTDALFASPENINKGLATAGVMAADFVDWSLQGFPDETGMRKRVADTARESAAFWDNAAKAKTGTFAPQSAESYFQQAGSSIGTSLLAAPFGAGGQNAALTMFGLFADGGYQKMRDAGVSVPMSAGLSVSNSAMEGLTEKLGLDALYKGTGPVIKKALGFLLGDLAGEEINTLYNSLVDKVTVTPDMSMKDVVQSVVDTLIVTSIAGPAQGVSMSGAARVSNSLMDNYQAQQQAKAQEEFLLALGSSVTATKTFSRLPSKIQELVREIKKDGDIQDIYVPVERFNELFQSQGMEPTQAAEQILSDPQWYYEAAATGGDVAIPLEDYAKLANAPFYSELAKDSKTSLGGMTSREAEAFSGNQEKNVNDILAQLADEAPDVTGEAYQSAYQRIYDDTYGQLIGINQNPEEAQANATVRAKGLATLAQRYGYDADTLMNQFPITVTRGDLPKALQKQESFTEQQQAAQLSSMLDNIRTGKGINQGEIFGQSLGELLRDKGINDDRGDLASMDIDKGLKFKKKMLRKDGISLDRARELAVERGYLPEDATTNDLLEAIDSELRGQPKYSPEFMNYELQDKQLALDELAQWLDSMGLDLAQMGNETVLELMQNVTSGGNTVLDQTENNASGESSASLEALNRLKEEKKQGKKLFRVNRAGNLQPLYGVDAVDMNHADGEAIVEISNGEWRRVKGVTSAAQEMKLDKLAAVQTFFQSQGGKLGAKSGDFGVGFTSKLGKALAGTGYNQAIPFQSNMDSASFGAQYFSDLLKSHSISVKKSGLFGTPSFVSMMAQVRTAILDNPQIVDTIVGTVPVDVVNNLFGSEGAAKMLLHDEAVNKNSPTFDADLMVTGNGEATNPVHLLMLKVASMAAKVESALGSGESRLKASESLSALGADGVNSFSQGKPPKSGKRASITLRHDGTVLHSVVSLFKDADASSFLHEVGHYYLEVLGTLANSEGAPEALANDYKTLLDWLEVKQSIAAIKIDGAVIRGNAGETHEDIIRRVKRADDPTGDGSWDAFKVGNVTVIKNATDSDIKDMAKAFHEKYPSAERGSIKSRSTYDKEGNRYSWPANEATHADIEPAINDRYKTKTSQNQFMLKPDLSKGEKGYIDSNTGDFTMYNETPVITVEQNEKFARGFEAYLYEGNAPSQELRGVFQRFKTWLKAVYTSMKSLNVELTDDVRGVFDRLLATDEEIAAAEKEMNVKPVFATAKEAGMSEAVFSAYLKLAADAHEDAKDHLERKKLKEIKRTHETWWKEARVKMVSDVEADAKQQPVYEALNFLYTGKLFDGSEYQGGSFKLSGPSLRKQFDEPTMKMIRKKLGDVYRNEGGIEPSLVAEMFGFSSADEMIKRMTEVPKLREFVQSETDRRMNEEFGQMNPAELADEAVNAVHSDSQSDLLREELKAIRRKQKEVKPFADAAVSQEKAEREYERRWMEAERKLAVAMERGAKQAEIDDLTASIKADKERQRDARKLAKESVPPVKFFKEAAQRHIAGLKVSEITPGKFSIAEAKAAKEAFELNGKGDFERAAKAKTRQLLNHFLFREATAAREEADKISADMRKLESGKAQARIGKAGQDYLEQVNALLDQYEFRKVPYTSLQAREDLLSWVERKTEANGFPPAVAESVLREARQVNYRQITMQQLRDVSDSIEAIVHLARLENKLLKAEDQRDIMDLADEAAASIELNSRGKKKRKPEKSLPQDMPGKYVENYFASHRKMSSLARQMDGGADGGAVWNMIIRPMNEAADREAVMRAEAAGKLSEVFGVYTGLERTKMHKREFVQEIDNSISTWGRIVVALNMGNEGNLQRLHSMYTPEEIKAIVEPLDARDWNFINEVWALLESYWPAIEAKEKRVNGVAPQKVDALPVVTKYGTLTGGYFPLKYDAEETAKAGAQTESEIYQQMMGGAFTRATTRHGHTEARLEAVNRPLTLSIDVVFQHLNQVIHDLTHHEMLYDVNRLLGTTQIQEAMRDNYGMEIYKVFTDGLRDVAVGDIPAQDAFEKFMQYTRVGISTAGLGLNLVTSLMQPLGLTQSIARIGVKWVGKGIGRWISSPTRMIETAEWIYSVSDFMKTRAMTQTREIAEIRNQMTVGVIPHSVRDSFFYFIQQFQKVVDIPTWLGQYEKSMSEHGNEKDSIAEADQAVIDSQASGQMKDLARIQKGGPLKKMFTTFYSFFSTTYNLAAESKARTDFKSPAEAGRFMVDMLLLYVVPVVLVTLLKEGIQHGIGGGDDDEEKLLKKIVSEELSYVLGGFIGMRELGSVFSGFQGYEGPAGARFYSETAKLMKEVGQGEADAGLLKRLNSLGGILLHYPSTQVQRTVDGMIEIAEGRGNILSLFFGKPKKK